MWFPAPTAYPFTRAMIGLGQWDSVWWKRYGSRICRSSPPSFSQFTSPPAQKALAPAPVRTITPTSGSAPALSIASVISRSVSPVNALYCVGAVDRDPYDPIPDFVEEVAGIHLIAPPASGC